MPRNLILIAAAENQSPRTWATIPPLKRANNTIKGRRRNRRVEVKVLKNIKAKQEIILPKWNNMERGSTWKTLNRQKGKQ